MSSIFCNGKIWFQSNNIFSFELCSSCLVADEAAELVLGAFIFEKINFNQNMKVGYRVLEFWRWRRGELSYS